MILTALRCAGVATAGAPGCRGRRRDRNPRAFAEATDPVLVVSGDRDLLKWWPTIRCRCASSTWGRGLAKAPADGAGRGSRALRVDPRTCRHRLRGDVDAAGRPSDGLPGVPGIGEDRGETPRRIRQPRAHWRQRPRRGHRPSSHGRSSLLESADYLQAAPSCSSRTTPNSSTSPTTDLLHCRPGGPPGLPWAPSQVLTIP